MQTGARLLECNGRSLLGCTQADGKAELGKDAESVTLLVQQLSSDVWAGISMAVSATVTEAAAVASAFEPRSNFVIDDCTPTDGPVVHVSVLRDAKTGDFAFSHVGSCANSFGGVFVKHSVTDALHAGDRIVAINNHSLLSASDDDAAALFQVRYRLLVWPNS